MKFRKPLIILIVMFSGLAFSACADESENILPEPLNVDEPAATVVDGGEKDDPMD